MSFAILFSQTDYPITNPLIELPDHVLLLGLGIQTQDSQPSNPPITPPTRPIAPIITIKATPSPPIIAPAKGIIDASTAAIMKKGMAEMTPKRKPTPAPPLAPPLHMMPAIIPPINTEMKGVKKMPRIIVSKMPIMAGPKYLGILSPL